MTNSVTQICDAVMRSVVRGLPIGKTVANHKQAVEVMRAEIKALLVGDEYEDARDCILQRSLHDNYVIGIVAANCLSKITLTAAERAAEIGKEER